MPLGSILGQRPGHLAARCDVLAELQRRCRGSPLQGLAVDWRCLLSWQVELLQLTARAPPGPWHTLRRAHVASSRQRSEGQGARPVPTPLAPAACRGCALPQSCTGSALTSRVAAAAVAGRPSSADSRATQSVIGSLLGRRWSDWGGVARLCNTPCYRRHDTNFPERVTDVSDLPRPGTRQDSRVRYRG